MSEDLTSPRSYEPDFVSKRYRKELDTAFAPVMERLKDDVAVRLVRAAVVSVADPATFDRSATGYLPPAEYERAYFRTQAEPIAAA